MLPFYSALMKPHLECCVQLSSTRERWNYWRESSEGPLRWLRDSHVRKGCESSEKRRLRGDLINAMCINT